MKLWVNLNTYNEKENIEPMAQAILSQPLSGLTLAIIDDNSPDGTGHLADKLALKDSRVVVIHRAKKEGIGPAYRQGLARGLAEGNDYFIQIDCDFSHDPNDLSRMVALLQESADLVIGSRYIAGGRVRGVPAYRQWISHLGNWYIEQKLHLPIADVTAGFVGFRRPALECLDIDTIGSQGYAWQIETKVRAVRLGLRIKELPIVFRERRADKSKFTWSIASECLRVVDNLARG
ncbi:MAG: polyprenol monophosphomannose synthase [Candidatus Komeilibacteria bacterium]